MIFVFSPFALQDIQLANPLSWQSLLVIRSEVISFSSPTEAAACAGRERQQRVSTGYS